MAFHTKPGIVVLTGAGISAESGIRTFRASDGLWEEHRVEDVASPEGFDRDPDLVWRFYKERYTQALSVKPNAAHHALVKLERAFPSNFYLITQNVDGLHARAGQESLIEMHGRLRTCLCTNCKLRIDMNTVDLSPSVPRCPKCGGFLRPDIVWFGEIPYELARIESLLQDCVLFLVIGTSGVVYPAAGFLMTAKYFGAKTICVNPDKVPNRDLFDQYYQDTAANTLPGLVDHLIELGLDAIIQGSI